MSTLYVQDLDTTLTQVINVEKRIMLKAIRPYLYIHKLPSGTFTLNIKHAGNLVATKSLTSTEIETQSAAAGLAVTSSNYFHGRITFDFDLVILNKAAYTIELVGEGGYSFSPSNFIGWIKEYIDRVNRIVSEPGTLQDSPLSLEIWSYKDGRD